MHLLGSLSLSILPCGSLVKFHLLSSAMLGFFFYWVLMILSGFMDGFRYSSFDLIFVMFHYSFYLLLLDGSVFRSLGFPWFPHFIAWFWFIHLLETSFSIFRILISLSRFIASKIHCIYHVYEVPDCGVDDEWLWMEYWLVLR